jgi:NRAMP (natural resistance-associated macrophage protein)-like metal ion transporter
MDGPARPGRGAGRSAPRGKGVTPDRGYFRTLGPGLVTGASDDDPSGIATYSIAGASLGPALLWTALWTLPLMAAVELTCARIGLVSGRGIAGAVRRHAPRPLLYGACALVVVANVFNISADLAGMADAIEVLVRVPSVFSVPVLGAGILAVTVYARYATVARYLKWLTLVLFAYTVAAVLARPDWRASLPATFVPAWRLDPPYVEALLGILGTTISPYLFFWQASQEVEEETAQGRRTLAERRGATKAELRDARTDVVSGMVLSNFVMYCIMLTTASTLHRAGLRDIASSREAAEALRPLAGDAAYVLYTLGIVGTGLLAIPVLAGSASYAVSEAFGWRAGLDLPPRRGRRFYLVLGAAVVGGVLLDGFQLNPIRLLFLAALVNGLLAPPLLVLVMLAGNSRRIMGDRVNGFWLNLLGWTAVAVMTAAGVAFVWGALARARFS